MILVMITIVPLFFIITLFESTIWRMIVISIISVIWLLIAIYFVGMERGEKKAVIGFARELIARHLRRKAEVNL